MKLMGVTRNELGQLVVALSAACKKDKNVLKDSELVDALEKYGQQVARLRKITISRLHGSYKTVENLEEDEMSGAIKANEVTLKRRKLSMDAENKISECLDYRHDLHVSCMFPSIERQQKPKRMCMGKWTTSIQSNKNDVMIDFADAVDCYQPTTVVAAVKMGEDAVTVNEEAMMASALKTHQYYHTYRGVSPQLKTPRAARAALPLKQLDRAGSPNSVDLLASSTSTMASFYDDLYDENAVCPEMMQLYTRSAIDRTSSFESMDWTRSDDGSADESMQFRSIANDVEQQPLVSRMVARQQSIHASDTRVNGSKQYPEHSAETCYVTAVNESTAEPSSRVTSVMPRNNTFLAAPSSTEVMMEVLYGIMEHNENFKWLLDPVNQSRVAKLVEYHMKNQQNDVASNQAYDDKQLVNELQAHVDELVHENLKIKTENVQLMGKGSQSAAMDKNVKELERRLAMSEEAINMQKKYRGEAEAAFQRELETQSKLVSNLQHDLEKKDSQIASFLENGAEQVANEGIVRTAEVIRLENTVMEKNREICRLNFQLSTKQKLITEIAKEAVQQLRTTLNIPSDEAFTTLADGFRVDVDMFLFKSLAKKQETIDELKAALLSMEHEVSGLEARVAKQARDTLLLKTKFKSMSSRLAEANMSLSRVQTENGGLVASLKEKQGKMHDLLEFLEGKEKQVMHLEEQIKLRQAQLDHVMTEYEKLQHEKLDKKSVSGHLSRCKTRVLAP